jgi:hypothetical protein
MLLCFGFVVTVAPLPVCISAQHVRSLVSALVENSDQFASMYLVSQVCFADTLQCLVKGHIATFGRACSLANKSWR